MSEKALEALAANSGDLSQNEDNIYFGLYKYYFDLVVRINTVYFAIVGALLTFLSRDLSDCANQRYLPFLLCLPCILSISQSIIYFNSLRLSAQIYERIIPLFFPVLKDTAIKEPQAPPKASIYNPLKGALLGFGITHLLLFLGLTWAIYYLWNFSVCH